MLRVNYRKRRCKKVSGILKVPGIFFEKTKRIITDSRLSGKKGSEGDGTD